MAKNEKEFVKEIADMNEDFPRWYTDIVLKTELVDYGAVKGTMVIRPYGYAIWEIIQSELDKMIKATGHKNAYFPMLIPYSYLTKEAEHVEGFAPEVALVTKAGGEDLAEPLVIRPTSETIICEMYAKWVKSYRDLPMKLNQWCNVLRWEKTTRPFLRTSEFIWQEGHTLHSTEEEAQEETLTMLNVYKTFVEKFLSMPVLVGRKSDKEKFAGASATYTMEAMMKDGKSLQAGTSHNLGTHFAEAFNIKYLDKDGKQKYPFQTSWGVTTRLIGAMIMVHGDQRGLVLPPRVAPTQAIIIPIASHKEGVMEKCDELYNALKEKGVRIDIDDSEQSTGWKFNQSEMKGIPVRIEVGPRDLENGQVTLFRRDTLEKEVCPLEEVENRVPALIEQIADDMLVNARKFRDANIVDCKSLEDITNAVNDKKFARAMWCGCKECEDLIKATNGATSRVMEFEQKEVGDTCAVCGKKTKKVMIFARSY